MPISFEIEKSIIQTKMEGDVGANDITLHIEALKDLELINDCFIELVDITEVERLEVNSDFAHELSQSVTKLHSKYKKSHIFVVVKNELQYGINRMIQSYITIFNPTVEWHIVQSFEDAEIIIKSMINKK